MLETSEGGRQSGSVEAVEAVESADSMKATLFNLMPPVSVVREGLVDGPPPVALHFQSGPDGIFENATRTAVNPPPVFDPATNVLIAVEPRHSDRPTLAPQPIPPELLEASTLQEVLVFTKEDPVPRHWRVCRILRLDGTGKSLPLKNPTFLSSYGLQQINSELGPAIVPAEGIDDQYPEILAVNIRTLLDRVFKRYPGICVVFTVGVSQ